MLAKQIRYRKQIDEKEHLQIELLGYFRTQLSDIYEGLYLP